MNCNMMSKRLCLRVTIGLLLVGLMVTLANRMVQAAEIESEVLLIYEENAPQEVLDQIKMQVDQLTYMRHSVTYQTVEEAIDHVWQYSYLIAWQLDGDELELAKVLAQLEDQKQFIAGSSFYQLLCREKRIAFTALKSQTGVLSYQFSVDNQQEGLVELKDLVIPQEPQLYENGVVSVQGNQYPFCSGDGQLRYTPVSDFQSGFLQTALIQEMTDWMWPYDDAPHTYGQYLVLDQIYPYTDPAVLLEKIQVLIDEGLPFVLSVMPVYQNEEYPAMQQLCEVLRYAQDNGGAIILHAPILQIEDPTLALLQTTLTQGMQSYIQWGVYPLGIEVPYDWILNESCRQVLRRYSTVFINQDTTWIQTEDFFSWDYNILYYNYHQLIAPVLWAGKDSIADTAWYSTATYLDQATTDVDRIRQVADEFRSSRAIQKDLMTMSHEVWGENLHLSYSGHVLKVNEQIVSLDYVPQEKDEDFDYQRNTLRKISFDIQNESGLILVISTVAIFIFIVLIIWGRITNRRHFFPKKQKQVEDPKE